MKEITIIWIGKDGKEISREYTGDEDTPENRAALEEYINDTTEGLDAPEGWHQFDLVGEEVV